MPHPTVSIIIPAFNAEHVLRRSVRSVIKQSYPRWELIIVNDGSNDDSYNLLEITP